MSELEHAPADPLDPSDPSDPSDPLDLSDPADPDPVDAGAAKRPLYPRLLRLRHIHPSSWQRALLGEGMAAVGGLLAMADLASAWAIVALPVAVAAVVKGHDLLAGVLRVPDLADDPQAPPGPLSAPLP